MSRSRRKTPICGITTAESDKAFKVMEHRRARRKLSAIDLVAEDPPHPKQFGNPWYSDKEVKLVFDPAKCPKVLRK